MNNSFSLPPLSIVHVVWYFLRLPSNLKSYNFHWVQDLQSWDENAIESKVITFTMSSSRPSILKRRCFFFFFILFKEKSNKKNGKHFLRNENLWFPTIAGKKNSTILLKSVRLVSEHHCRKIVCYIRRRKKETFKWISSKNACSYMNYLWMNSLIFFWIT